MKKYNKFFGIFIGFTTFIALLYIAFIPTAYNNSFYHHQFKENLSHIEANVSEEQLNLVIDHVLDYLKDKEKDLQITITLLNGTTKDAFTEREIAHMVDVKKLFINGEKIGIGAIILSIISLGLLYFRRKSFDIQTTKYIKYTILGIIISFGLIGLYAFIDFNNAFTLFHKIFFTNDLWLLDYNDLLIIMLPETLFFNIAFQILLLFFVYLAIYLLFLRFYEKKIIQHF